MSAFSRGCLLRHQFRLAIQKTPRSLSRSNSSQYPRLFSYASILQAVKKSRPSPPLKQALPQIKPSYTRTKPSTTTPPPIYQSFASTLAQKSHPSLLYQAPSHTVFIISAYGTAIFCFSYAAISFWSNYLDAPADLPSWVPIAHGGICFMMAALGGWFLLTPTRLVRTITAIPQAASSAAGANVARATAPATASAAPELKLEIELKKMFPLPFFPSRKLYVKPEEVVLPYPLVPVDKRVTAEEVRVMRQREEVEKQEMLEYERSHIMTAPFRHANRAFYSLFKSLGRIWTREGFLKIDIKGQIYKLDITGGWALDGGKALDRLLKVKPRY